MARTIVLIRHGETEWSRAGRHTGHTDLPLTPVGEREALALRPVIDSDGFALVLTSPLQRARRTAELAGLHATVEPNLIEWDYGELEGRTAAEMEAERPGWAIWRDGPPGGEPLEALAERTRRVLTEVSTRKPPDQAACLIAHGHVLRVLTATWLGLPPTAAELFRLQTSAVCELSWSGRSPVVALWNSTVRGGRHPRPA